MFKKLLASFLIVATLFLSFAPYSSVKAQSNWYDQSFQEWFNKVYDDSNPSEIFGERYTAAQVQWIIYSLFSFVVPEKGTIQCFLSGDIGGCLDEIGSTFGLTDAALNPNLPVERESLSSAIFSPGRPLSFISYVDRLSNKVTLVPEVHAQSPGFGFESLQVIRELWVASRNIVYGLIVLVAIILAFMVMFRMKISPQVVITIQSAIPKIIISLVLVTFSYAIAGLLVDLMYVVTGIISLALSSTSDAIFVNDALAIFKFMTTGYIGINAGVGISVGIFGLFLLYILVFTVILFLALFAAGGGVFGNLGTLGLLGNITGIISIIAFVIMLIIVILNAFKTWWMLIKAFAQILLLTIAAPFQIAFGTIIPGMGFGSWVKSMAANLAVFPVTGLFLILSFVFLIISTQYSIPAGFSFEWWKLLYILPGIGTSLANRVVANSGWPPLLGSSDAMLGLIFAGASVMVLTLIPKVAEIIKGAISGRPFAYGSAIGEGLAPIKGTWDRTGGTALSGIQKAGSEAFGRDVLDKYTKWRSSRNRPKSGA